MNHELRISVSEEWLRRRTGLGSLPGQFSAESRPGPEIDLWQVADSSMEGSSDKRWWYGTAGYHCSIL